MLRARRARACTRRVGAGRVAWRVGAWRGALHDGAMRQADAVLPSRPRAWR
jgi:hypothetical protein